MTALPCAIGFDYGNTLVSVGYPKEGLRRAGHDVLRVLASRGPSAVRSAAQVGLEIDTRVDQLVGERHLRDPLHEVDIQAVYRQALLEILGVEADAQQVGTVCRLLQQPWAAAMTVLPDALAAVVQLRRLGARLGVLSNAPYPPLQMHRMLEDQGLARHFDAIIFSSEIGVRKPAPAAFAALLAALRTSPEQTWFVGDEPLADVAGAKAAGLRPLLAPTAPAGARAGAVEEICLSSWEELPRRWQAARAGDASRWRRPPT